ncbi:hypothetical protein D3C81_507630 [compost metagenome]
MSYNPARNLHFPPVKAGTCATFSHGADSLYPLHIAFPHGVPATSSLSKGAQAPFFVSVLLFDLPHGHLPADPLQCVDGFVKHFERTTHVSLPLATGPCQPAALPPRVVPRRPAGRPLGGGDPDSHCHRLRADRRPAAAIRPVRLCAADDGLRPDRQLAPADGRP